MCTSAGDPDEELVRASLGAAFPDSRDAFSRLHTEQLVREAAVLAQQRNARRGVSGPTPMLAGPRRLAACAGTVLALIAGSSSVAAASSRAVPGEVLYPVKHVVEQAWAFTMATDLRAAQLELRFAERRLEENNTIIARGGPYGQLPRLRAAFDEHLARAARLAGHLVTERVVALQARWAQAPPAPAARHPGDAAAEEAPVEPPVRSEADAPPSTQSPEPPATVTPTASETTTDDPAEPTEATAAEDRNADAVVPAVPCPPVTGSRSGSPLPATPPADPSPAIATSEPPFADHSPAATATSVSPAESMPVESGTLGATTETARTAPPRWTASAAPAPSRESHNATDTPAPTPPSVASPGEGDESSERPTAASQRPAAESDLPAAESSPTPDALFPAHGSESTTTAPTAPACETNVEPSSEPHPDLSTDPDADPSTSRVPQTTPAPASGSPEKPTSPVPVEPTPEPSEQPTPPAPAEPTPEPSETPTANEHAAALPQQHASTESAHEEPREPTDPQRPPTAPGSTPVTSPAAKPKPAPESHASASPAQWLGWRRYIPQPDEGHPQPDSPTP